MNKTETIFSLAIIKAKSGKRDQLFEALLKLIEPTRMEPGNLDYVLFEHRDEPGTFYMREAFVNQAALDQHFETHYLQAFIARFDELLEEPLQLIFLDKKTVE